MASMKKRRKQRRPKVTKKELKNVCVDGSGAETENFLDEIIRWFSDHQQKTDQLFSGDDTDRGGSVNMEDFELGLMKLGIPCGPSQLHMLTQQLQTSSSTISYHDFISKVHALRAARCAQISEDVIKRRGAAEAENLSCLESQHQPNPENHRVSRLLQVSVLLWSQKWEFTADYSSFVRLNVRLIPFDAAAAHPGNFELVLSSSSRVFSLIQMIQDHVRIPTCRLEVFRSRMPTEEARLNPESSLEECGFKGGPEESPPEATVYYDYTLLFTDCPILNCDHYFR